MSGAPRFAPSSLNCTLWTPTSSDAVAATDTTPDTVAPAAGEVSDTVGAVVSACAVPLACADARCCRPHRRGHDDVVVGARREPRIGVGGRAAGHVATRLAALGANPVVVERCTRYSVTPTLSVDADQFSRTPPSCPVAVRFPGADGGVVSVGAGCPAGVVHVRLNLARAEGAVVDADVVEPALEPFAEAGVAAEAQRRVAS